MSNNTGSVSPINVDSQLYPALIQCFVIIALGYILGHLNLLTNTHGTGLSRYISNCALPAVIFRNLVLVQFNNLSWPFMGAVLIAKTLSFIITAILTAIIERPRNYASIGLYPIIISQTNDFALILPIIDAVYSQSHPEYSRYIYLAAPISLAILNPIGFLLIELQNRLDQQKKNPEKAFNRCKVLKKIIIDIIRNPVIICTILGIVFNRILNQSLPVVLDKILTPLSQSFSGIALFYLGLSMVGKLRTLNVHVVITVFLLSIMKLIIFPLILRQSVFFLLSSANGTSDETFDYSNFGFLYGTAPTAPSVVFYVPESNTMLQAVAATSLVVSTVLSGPIMFISARMISMRDFDANTTETYEWSLIKTGYDVNIISFICTIVVFISFCLRGRYIKVSYIHRYSFIFVIVQTIRSIWSFISYYYRDTTSETISTVFDVGSMFLALCTRSWVSSISIVLMITVCYSSRRASQYSWVYHLYAWLAPGIAVLVVYLKPTIDRSKHEPIMNAEKFGMIQVIASFFVLVTCVTISMMALLRIAREAFLVKDKKHKTGWVLLSTAEESPLIINRDIETSGGSISTDDTISKSKKNNPSQQLLRHGILVTFLTINSFTCACSLLWAWMAKTHDGIYYELQFLDTALLNGQGIITFLVFALDSDLLLPCYRKIRNLWRKVFSRHKQKISVSSDLSSSTGSERTIDFVITIRPDFIRQLVVDRSENGSNDEFQSIFNGQEFCEWLVSNGYKDNEAAAECYCRELIGNKYLICINREQNEISIKNPTTWFAFSKF